MWDEFVGWVKSHPGTIAIIVFIAIALVVTLAPANLPSSGFRGATAAPPKSLSAKAVARAGFKKLTGI